MPPEDLFSPLRTVSGSFFPQVLTDYLVKKLETEPFIYSQPRICSCRTSELPRTTLGATSALTCGDHPYRRWEGTRSCSSWLSPGQKLVFYETIAHRWETKPRPPRKFWLSPRRWETSTLSPSHPGHRCNSWLFKNKRKNLQAELFLRSQPGSLAASACLLSKDLQRTQASGESDQLYFS